VHSRVRGGSPWPEHNVAVGLLTEGLATHVSAQAMPGLSDAEYLWMGRGHDGWLQECRRQWPDITARISHDMDADDLDTYAIYFLMRDSPARGDLPLRSGYLLGLQMVRSLQRTYTVAEISGWGPDRAKQEIRAAALPNPDGPNIG
jgi:hypothetical protein